MSNAFLKKKNDYKWERSDGLVYIYEDKLYRSKILLYLIK